MVLLALIPSGLFTPDGSFGPAALLLQLAGGFIIAVGLVLPGISVSQMLYMLGIYETIIGNISSFHILPLIPLGAGVLGGIFLTTKVLERVERYFLEEEKESIDSLMGVLGFSFAGNGQNMAMASCASRTGASVRTRPSRWTPCPSAPWRRSRKSAMRRCSHSRRPPLWNSATRPVSTSSCRTSPASGMSAFAGP